MKKLLSATSAAALVIGLVTPAFANPTVKNSYDVWDLVDIYIDDIVWNDDVAIESYNAAVLSETYQYGEVYYPKIYQDNYRDDNYVYSGDVDMDDTMENAAGQFSYVVNTGFQNVNQAAASIAANADVTFSSD